MFRSLKDQLFKRAKQLGVLEKMNEQKAFDRVHKIIEELAGEGAAHSVRIKQGVLFVQCKSPTTAHFLRLNEERVKLVAQVNSVRFLS